MRRRLVVFVALAALLATAGFGALAHSKGTADDASPSHATGPSEDPAPIRSPARGGAVGTEPAAGGVLATLYWAAASLSGLVLLTSLGFVRREVAVEKSRRRKERVKRALAQDLRDYQRARQGTDPPNT